MAPTGQAYDASEGLVARAREAGAVLAPLSSRIEAERRLPPEAVRALVDAGVFKMMVPRAFGGAQADVATALAVIEEVARADGSAGWCAMIGASSGLMATFLDEAVAREAYGPADAISCGVFAPMGRATRVDGGYRVSGRWAFASGCQHSPWRMGGALVEGEPGVRSFLFREGETRIVDTWDVSGLRGTGSHDLEVKDVVVPVERSFSFFADRPRHEGPPYTLPFFGVLAAGIAAVGLGVARAAIEAFVELAGAKHPQASKRTLAHRELAQLHVARAEAKVRAARAWLHESLADAAREVEGGGLPSPRTRALFRLAACHASTEAAAAVDLVYDAGGGSSIYAKSPLQRCFRDVHVATQHVMVSPTTAITAGRVLLGVETDVAML